MFYFVCFIVVDVIAGCFSFVAGNAQFTEAEWQTYWINYVRFRALEPGHS